MLAFTQHVSKLCGYAPALPTPFRSDESVDFAALERLCERQIERGANALVVCGTTGEAPTLTAAEHRSIVATAVRIARGRVPVIAGAGSNSTAHAITLTKDAEAAGADAALSIVPYYNKPTQAGLYAHFSAIAQGSALPIILYDVPSRTACALADDTVVRLAELPQIIGLKDATGDVTRPQRLRRMVPEHFRLLTGDDATALAFFAQGGDGCISVTSNVAPALCRSMFLWARRGSLVHAQRLSAAISRLTELLFKETNPAPVKYALSLFGLVEPNVRLPLVEASVSLRTEIDACLGALSIGYPDELVGELESPPIRNPDLILDRRMSFV